MSKAINILEAMMDKYMPSGLILSVVILIVSCTSDSVTVDTRHSSSALSGNLVVDNSQKMVEGSNALDITDGLVIGMLKTRDNIIITIYAGEDGPLYSVTDENGTVQTVALPASLFAKKFPALKHILELGNANDANLYSIGQRESKLDNINQDQF